MKKYDPNHIRNLLFSIRKMSPEAARRVLKYSVKPAPQMWLEEVIKALIDRSTEDSEREQ